MNPEREGDLGILPSFRRGGAAMRPSLEKAQIQRWVATWREAGPALDAQRRGELEQLTTPRALAQLAAAFEHARRRAPLSDTSGLVEQQRYFQQLQR